MKKLNRKLITLALATLLCGTSSLYAQTDDDKEIKVKDKDGNEVPVPFSFGDTTPPLFSHHGFWYTDIPYESTSPDCVLTDEKEFFRRRMAFTNEQNYS